MTHHYPDLGSDALSVWNFCARFSGIISQGKPLVASQNFVCFLRLGHRGSPWTRCIGVVHGPGVHVLYTSISKCPGLLVLTVNSLIINLEKSVKYIFK